jgi:hypothetical protein
MFRPLCLLSILLVLWIPSNAFAVPPDAPSFLSSTLWSNPNSVRVLDGIAYVAYPHGLAVFDVTDPSAPLLLGKSYCSGPCGRLEIAWPYVLVGGGPVIQTFDVGDPSSPRAVGAYPVDGDLVDFAFRDNLAYVVCGSSERRLEVVDFSYPAAPVLLGSCPTAGLGIALAGSYAYLPAYHDGVAVIDVSQPAHPMPVGRWDIGIFFTIRVQGSRAYCIWTSGEKREGVDHPRGTLPEKRGDRVRSLRDESGVIVYDITSPLQPAYLGEYQGTDWSRDVYFDDGLAYVASGSGTATILDFSDPSNPVIVGHLVTGGNSADLAFQDGVVHVADGPNGLVTMDVSDPGAPILLGRHWEAGYPSGIAVDDRAAYLADGTFGLHVVDIRNPFQPEEISRLETPANPRTVLVSGEFVYLGNREDGFDVVDVVDLGHPVLVAHLDLPVSGMAIAGDRAYVVKDDRFTSIDIHDPTHPIILGSCTVPLWAWEVCVHGNFAYVGNSNVGLVVVDISNPAYPFRRGSVDTFDWVYDVVTDGSFVYANLGNNRLGVFDVTNPDLPRSVLELQLPGWLNQLELAGDRLFAAADPGVRVYDVSNPGSPVEVGLGDAAGGAIAIRETFLYLVGGGSMLVLGPSAAAVEAEETVQEGLRLLAANPLRDDGVIRLRLDRPGPLTVAVYDVAGRRVATLHDGTAAAGEHALCWPAGNSPAGVYYLRAESGGRTAQRALQLVR